MHPQDQKGNNLPDNRPNLDRSLPAKHIRQETRDQGTEPGATSHGGSDATLDIGMGTSTVHFTIFILDVALVEVAEVGFRADDGGHGRDVKPEQTTAEDGDGRDHVQVANKHGGYEGRTAVGS